MPDPDGKKFIVVVAQPPFEAPSASGTFNQFCSLIPVLDSDGKPANKLDFPDFGDLWWMLRPATRGFAQPGRLLTSLVQQSAKYGEPNNSQFQAVADSVEPVRSRDFTEIVTVPVGSINNIRELVTSNRTFVVDHPTLSSVYVRWGNKLIGRLVATAGDMQGDGRYKVSFKPESTDQYCHILDVNLLDRLPAGKQAKFRCPVSLESRPGNESSRTHEACYHLVESDALDSLIDVNAERLSLKTDEEIIRQLAKRFLTRSKRQQLSRMLEELSGTVSSSPEATEDEERTALEALQYALDFDSAAIDKLATSIVNAGLLQDQFDKVIEQRVDQHIAENEARLQAEIHRRTSEARQELENLQSQRDAIDTELAAKRLKETRSLEMTLEERRRQFEQTCEAEKQQIQKKLAELKRQEQVLSDNLEKVAGNLSLHRDEVVNQFLTIAPLLGQLGLLPGGNTSTTHPKTSQEKTPQHITPSTTARFHVPTFTVSAADEPITEVAFFERFKALVEESGYRYREIDLVAFHMSVKCGDLTILGGLPGTGKSSLCRFYADAIRGMPTEEHPNRYLHIAVSPSWLDMQDLIGHVNALTRTFQPADSSLFQHLVCAQEEYRQAERSTGLYLACLDEMNLSHIEHYFTGLLQVLEHPEGHRQLRCFAENSVDIESDFSKWAILNIPRSVRFIGTVNFDETTKQLSQRVLDRANVIRLPSNILPLQMQEMPVARAAGPPVRLQEYQSWINNTAGYSDELATLIDEVKDDLEALACPMNPRRFSAMRRYMASWSSDLPCSDEALDRQIAQRVLPQVRGLFQPGARRAVDSLRKKLDRHSRPFEESLRVLDEISRWDISDYELSNGDAE